MDFIILGAIFMSFRTDLAVERQEICAQGGTSDNVSVRKSTRGAAKITEIEILNAQGANELDKPCGRYITVELPAFAHDSELLDDRLTVLQDTIATLLPDNCGGVLVAGLGNENITPDALGPRTAHGIFATRHIDKALANELGFSTLREVSAVTFGVLGQTGIETAETIRGMVETVHPDVVITVDALAARSLARLGNTVQLTDTGITPGSGVGNSRARIDKETLGVPVIAIGVPTVVDATTLIQDFTNQSTPPDTLPQAAQTMMVTPREVDTLIHRASRFLSLAINCALQPDIEPEILLSLA